MKKASLVLWSVLAVCFAVVMLSCDKSEDVAFSVTLTHTFHVNQVAAGDGVIYQLDEILDAAAVSPDFNTYKENIKSVAVSGVTYTVQNVSTAGVILTNATIAYSAITATQPDPTIAVANIGAENIKAAENQQRILNFNQPALNDMSNWLTKNKQINLYLDGTLSTTPAKFDILVTINATVKANPIR
ncbi:MAG TPA: hypothetical protein VF473_09780 [Cyclobacteriaceae bacterium]